MLNMVNKIKIITIAMFIGAAAVCSSCNAGFDNSRIRSLDIDARRYYEEGSQFSRENKTDDAIRTFTKSIEAGPSAEAYNARAAEYNRKGRPDDAISDANRAIMMNEKYASPYFIRGNSYFKKGDFGKALKDYSRSIILDPEQPRCYFNLAQTYTRMGLTEEAVGMYGKAVDADSSYYAAHYNMACLYAQKNESDKALKSLELAIRTGFCSPSRLKGEKSFDPLRKSAIFRKLSAQLDAVFKSSRGCEPRLSD
jgi:tetratricopeptide (TPR) repeat protein